MDRGATVLRAAAAPLGVVLVVAVAVQLPCIPTSNSGADLTAVVEATGNTALHLAALNSREAAAKFLAERCPMLKDQIVNADGKLPREVAKGDACVAACS